MLQFSWILQLWSVLNFIMVLLVEVYLFVPLSLTVTTFQGYSTSNSSNWKCGFIWLCWNCAIVNYIKLFMNCVYYNFFTSAWLTWFLVWQKLLSDISFFSNCLSKVFQTLHGYKHNHAWGLQIHTRLDNYDLVSRWQKRELQN